MSNRTPPAWAKRLTQDLDRGYSREIGLTTKECALLITIHAPDAEALAVALEGAEEYLRQVCAEDAGFWGHKEIKAALAAYRAAHPKPAHTITE